MKRSAERILTTHTGSLPRPEKLVELMFAKEEGREVDERGWPIACAARCAKWSSASRRPASTSSATAR